MLVLLLNYRRKFKKKKSWKYHEEYRWQVYSENVSDVFESETVFLAAVTETKTYTRDCLSFHSNRTYCFSWREQNDG